MSRRAELGQQIVQNSNSSTHVSVLLPAFPIESEEMVQYNEENLVALLRQLSHQIAASLTEESSQSSNGQLQEQLVNQLLHGLLVIWLSGSRYQLLKKEIDPFAELVRLYDQLAKTDGWLEPPHLGEAVVELLQKFQPKSLPVAPLTWKPSLSVGVNLCRGLNILHRYPNLNPAMLFHVWLKLFEAPKDASLHLTSSTVTSSNSAKQPAKQLDMWSDVTAPTNESNGLEKVVADQIQATIDISGPFFVTNTTSGADLVAEFEQRVTQYQAENARILEVKPAMHTTSSATQLDMFGAAQLDMFGYVEQVADRPQVENNIPKKVLQQFQAASDLDLVRQQAASLALWFCALKAYAEHVSIFHALPDWELT